MRPGCKKIHSETYSYEILKKYIDQQSAFTITGLRKWIDNRINKSTIYRILSRLKNRGAIHSFTDDKGITWYAKCKQCSDEGHLDNHAHFKCVHCGKVECVDDVQIRISKSSKRSFSSQEVFLKGKCEVCQEDTKSNV